MHGKLSNIILILALAGAIGALSAAAQDGATDGDGGSMASAAAENADELVLDIEEAVDMALRNNLGLKAEKLSLQVAERSKARFWNVFLPQISTGATLYRSNEAPEGFSVPGFPPQPAPAHTWDFTWSFSASLTITSQIYFGIRKTFVDYDSGKINLETARKQLALDVRKAFYNLILLQQNMELMKQQIATAAKRYDQARINYENGLVSEYDMLSARVALENLKPGLQDMEVGYESALGSFKQLLGADRRRSVRIDGTISVEPRQLDADRLISGYVDGRLDIRSLKAAIESQENFRDITFTGLFPSVTFSYTMDPTFQKDPFKDPWFADIENDWAQKAGGFSITLNIPLTGFIPGSQTQVDLANQADEIRRTEINLAQARQGAALEIETIVNNLEKSISSIDTLKLNVQLAERAYRLAEEAYRAGNRELLEVQNAELELQKARNEVLKEQYNYTTGLLDLEYAINADIDKVGSSR